MSLNKALKKVLPEAEKFQTLHLRSPSIECHPLVTKQNSSNGVAPITVKAQHFFILFHKEKTIFGLEIYVYLTLRADGSSTDDGERMIFVSKADTTGHANCKVNYKDVTKVVIQYILSLDPNCYLQKIIPRRRDYDKIDATLITKKTSAIKALRILSNRDGSSGDSESRCQPQLYESYTCNPQLKTKLCLFTRPSPQYLFPESSKNPKKHVIDGERLLKWWLGILDDILLESFQMGTDARLRIPGEDTLSIKRYLRNVKYNWEVGDIFDEHDEGIAAFQIPLFPDDPKARFLRQLVEENRAHKTTLETFWIELQNRQEFKLSVTVSVIGIQGQTVSELLQQPSANDVILCPSKKQFNAIKRYVIGEKYDTTAGAIEAYSNVRDYLKIRLNHRMATIIGEQSADRGTENNGTVAKKTRLVATTLQPRKKPKRVNL